MSLVAEHIGFSANRRNLLLDVSLEIAPGEVHALLGPNGAGKTTLLGLLAGEQAPSTGHLRFDQRELSAWPSPDIAKRRAVLAQGDTLRFPLRSDEVVALGRLPHAPEAAANEARIVQASLAMCDAAALSHRSFLTLSGGERARVRLARALAQVWEQLETAPRGQPRYLLLDEPAAHLDPAHQHQVMATARQFADRGGGVLVTLHDPNLALAYADTATLLRSGQVLFSGAVAEALKPERLQALYDVQVRRINTEDGAAALLLGRTGRR